MARKMTLRQRKFSHVYLISNGNRIKALREAGYKPKPGSEKQLAYRILNSRPVKKYINRVADKMEKDFGITLDWKIFKLKRIVNFCVPDDEDKPVIDGAVGVKAIAELNKMQGDYAPVRNENTNANINADAEIKDMQELIKQHQRDY